MLTRRYRRLIALMLFAFQLTGARVHAITQGDATRTYFDSCITVKVLVKKITHQVLGKPATVPSLGQSRAIHTASDLETVKTTKQVAPVAVLTPAPVSLSPLARRASPELLAKLPSDLSPVQPSHLHSKK